MMLAMLVMCTAMAGALVGGCRSQPTNAPTHAPVTIAGHEFELELALTSSQRYQGLSDRELIPADGGMLFVFPYSGRQAFVMRRCLVPIDILFLDGGARVVSWHRMAVEPYDTPDYRLKQYASRYDATFAIELAGGTLDRLVDSGLKLGDRVQMDTQRLKGLAR